MSESIGVRLEQYTLKRRNEVLIVNLDTADGEPDRVMIFAGFSSSLTRATEYNPDIPIIAADSTINSIDRLVAPYNPNDPQYIETGLTLLAMENILNELAL